MGVTQVRKRSGEIVLFNDQKIVNVILKAMHATGEGTRKDAAKVTKFVVKKLDELFRGAIPGVEDVQDIVEQALMELQYGKVAKHYILYRNERSRLREQKAALIGGRIDDLKLTYNSVKLLERRYLRRNEKGEIAESPSDLFWRVANHAALAEVKQGGDPKRTAREFFTMMAELEFLPSSPVLMNANTERQLSSCYVLPIEDHLEGIFTTLQQATLIQKMGGGTGFSFSRIRPKGRTVAGIASAAAGPLAFLKVYSLAMETVRQSGRRDGANMAILRCDHPDILDFINLKLAPGTLQNFNLSVAVTDAFMEAVEKDLDYDLVNPATKEPAGRLSARMVFDSILSVAWRRGDPGLIFIDRLNEHNSIPHLAEIESVSPCGEQPLLPYESSVGGSVNLVACVGKGGIDKDKLKRIVHSAVRFLDNCIEVNNYPIDEAEQVARATRKLGLGVMGFADALFALRIPYASEKAVELARELASFITREAERASIDLARDRGTYPAFRGSEHERQNRQRRNACTTAISPTGSVSLLADVSSGIEPNWALAYTRLVAGRSDLLVVNEQLEHSGLESDILQRIAKRGFIAPEDDVPEKIREVFVTAMQIPPEWHIKVQAAWQQHIEGAISKTINYPGGAGVQEIEEGMLLAWKLKCKGITVYREGSHEQQILVSGT